MVPLAAAESRPSPHAPGAVLSLATTSLPPVPGSPGPSGPSDVDYHFATESKAGRTVRRSVSDAARGITVETEEEEQTTDGLEITRASITITEMQPIPDPETGVLTYVTTRRPVTAVRVAEVPAHVSP